jgi:hypothetical protein
MPLLRERLFYVMEEIKWKKKSTVPTVENLSKAMTMRKLAVRSFVLTAMNIILLLVIVAVL